MKIISVLHVSTCVSQLRVTVNVRRSSLRNLHSCMMLCGDTVSALDYAACSVGHEYIDNRAIGDGVDIIKVLVLYPEVAERRERVPYA